jgi:hypothetical protein
MEVKSSRDRRRNLNRGGTIGTSTIGESEFSRSCESRQQKPRISERIWTVQGRRDRCQRSRASRHIASREIVVFESKRIETLKVSKSRRRIWTVHGSERVSRDYPHRRTRAQEGWKRNSFDFTSGEALRRSGPSI